MMFGREDKRYTLRKIFGKKSEDVAVKYLERKNHIILDKNYRTSYGEIDIISCDVDTVVFTEVRSKSSVVYGLPEETVGKEKQKRIRKVAQAYLINKYKDHPNCRFDVIAITVDDQGCMQLRHYIDAF